MVDFAGWEMPIQYTGVMDEHRAVRTRAGLFDVSHMGEFEITGKDALACVQYLTVNDVSKLTDGQAQYSVLCTEEGKTIDDIIVYRFSAENFLLVVNAGNLDKDWNWVKKHERGNVTIRNASDETALIALQGPSADTILQRVSDISSKKLLPFHFQEGMIGGKDGCIVSRTGYTGESGVEIFCPSQTASHIWNSLLDAGKKDGLLPVGLGARDTLRLEMKYCLYGHELTPETNPLEAGLGWVVKLDTLDDFIGKAALKKIKAAGLTRKLVGFEMCERGIPREGYAIVSDGKPIGHVTSGTMSPSLGKPIGLGYVTASMGSIGAKFSIDIRGALREAVVVATPFYRKPKES